MKKRILMFYVILCILLNLVVMPASAEIVRRGTCGDMEFDNLIWTLDNTGTLTISGNGRMESYDDYEIDQYIENRENYHTDRIPPWTGARESIRTVVIENGVKRIGRAAFYRCSNITSLTIPASITEMRGEALDGCSSLTAINITDLAAWCKISFDKGPFCDNYDNRFRFRELYLNGERVTNLVIPDSITDISSSAFSGCSSLTQVTIHNRVKNIGDSAFSECNNISDVYYAGTAGDWSDISIGSGNGDLTEANIIFEYEKYPVIGKLVSCIYDEENAVATVEFKKIEKSCLVVFGVYDDTGRLVGLTDAAARPEDSEVSLFIPADEGFSGGTAKVFFWDSFSGLKPLGESIIKEIDR